MPEERVADSSADDQRAESAGIEIAHDTIEFGRERKHAF